MVDKEYAMRVFKASGFFSEIKDNLKDPNVSHTKQAKTIEELFERDVTEWVNYHAQWNTTPQGDAFWSDRNDCWKQFAYKNDIAYIKSYITDWGACFGPYKLNCFQVLEKCSFYRDYKRIMDDKGADLMQILFYTDVYEWLDEPFSWGDSPQGKEYWEVIDDLWREYLDTEDIGLLGKYYNNGPSLDLGSGFEFNIPPRRPITIEFDI